MTSRRMDQYLQVYSFEGVGMALPLETEMKDKSKFLKILALTMFFIALMYGSFGLLGYFAFGPETKDIITANMGTGLLSSIVKLGLCVNLFFTFPLMMNPVYEVFERTFWRGRYCLWLRWMIVLVVSLVALLVPNFADFMSLVGSSTCCMLGFVLPALFHYLTFKDEMRWRRASPDMCMMFLGVLIAVTGTWFSLEAIFSVKVKVWTTFANSPKRCRFCVKFRDWVFSTVQAFSRDNQVLQHNRQFWEHEVSHQLALLHVTLNHTG